LTVAEQGAHIFLRPLIGKTATFILDERRTNLDFARSVMVYVAEAGLSCTVFDLDALYSSNSEILFSNLPQSWIDSMEIIVPDLRITMDDAFPQIISRSSEVIIIDSLNTLYHLLGADEGASKSRVLYFLISALSYLASSGKKIVILTMYKREGFGRSGSKSISSFSSVTSAVQAKGEGLFARTVKGVAWPGGGLPIRNL